MEELIKKYKYIGCPYIINQMEKLPEDISLGRPKERCLNKFIESEEYKEIQSKYKHCILELSVYNKDKNTMSKFLIDLKDNEMYDGDYNSLSLNYNNIYNINSLKVKIKKEKITEIMLKEYIDIMKKHEELKCFCHEVEIDYNYESVWLLFGDSDVIVLDNFPNGNEVQKDDYYYDYKIVQVKLHLI